MIVLFNCIAVIYIVIIIICYWVTTYNFQGRGEEGEEGEGERFPSNFKEGRQSVFHSY